MKHHLGHKLVVADQSKNIIGLYYCSICNNKFFIGSENNMYKNSSYGGKIMMFNKDRNKTAWTDDYLTCEEILIKKLLE